MSTTQPPHNFKKLNGKVYWGARAIKGADYDSFEPLNLIWARDKDRIYSYDLPLRGADRNSFTVLNALFAKDNHRVYFLSGCIREANPATFHALDAGCFVNAWDIVSCQGYAADDEHAFHHVLTIGKPRLIKGADVATFRVLDYGFAVDKARAYFEGVRLPKADPAKFRPLGHYYGTDGTRVYYSNTALAGADPATFSVGPDDQLHGYDKNNKYDRHELVA